ncbi:palmitoyltransferase [Ceratobasidium sp. UAMH 11750]|nr:palmitoyltransferase [Ceratobasidium sp. UAMH 11750]
MRLYGLSILQVANGTSTVLSSASDLSTFSFYQRGTVGEFLTFSSKTIAERTPAGQRSSVQEGSYVFHVFNRGPSENLVGVLISDGDYPVRPAFTLLTKVLDEFATSVPTSSYANPSSISFAQVHTYVAKYQDPRQADSIMRVQQELDETKIVLHKTINAVLECGEKLDDLVDRSNQLSNTSKQFYKTAKKQNSCCVIA